MLGHALNSNNDIYIENGNFKLNDKVQNVAQNVKTRLQLFQGESVYNTQTGTPYYQDILGKGESLSNIARILKTVILDTENVLSLISFDLEVDKKRNLTVTFTANTTFGDTENVDISL